MAREEDSAESLFKRLTRLFRSGPVIKRKIKALDTTIAVPDKTKSSGTLLFQKSLSPTYATITANAYNLSERLMRYQDFQEMEYSIISTTRIPTVDGEVEIGELARRCEEDPNYTFIVYSYDHEKKRIVPALGKQARQTCVDHAWKITFDNGKTITASPEHRLMLRDGTYRKVEDLQPGDAMMPFYRRDLFANAKEGTKGYTWVYTMDEKFRGWTKEHQLIAEWVAGRPLTEDEVVHHINFDKTDNRPENLRIMTTSDHNSLHAAINNDSKWSEENSEWVEEFKLRHAQWVRDNAPTRRRDITFARIVEVAERVGFSMPAISSALDVTWNLIYSRLVANGFSTFQSFVEAYASGQNDTILNDTKPGLLTRDLSLELIKSVITERDTKRSLGIKLGCTINVLDKFLNRRLNKSWKQLRSELGFSDSDASIAQKDRRSGRRPKGSNGSSLTYKQICDAMEPGLTLPRLSEKLGANKNTITSRLVQHGHKKYSEFRDSYQNCKVVSVEYVGEMPLYDLTVDGYKNFATDSVVSHNTPEIASAMDIYADEAVSQDDKGRVLHVFSDNEKIKEILEDLFYNVLNVEFNLRSWVRNLVKYGDFFLYNDVSPEYGVINAFPIPVNEIEREENYDQEDPFAVRFRWVTLGNRTLENWEISHFRLLGNDMFLPYGSSVIEPARRIWRQLILIEDAMLVYRVVRAPERRVFYIDVANIPTDDVPTYMEEQKRQLRTSQVVDRETSRVDLRYNPLPVHKDTPVPLLDGRTLTIEELAKEHSSDTEKDLWVYSVQDKTNKMVPGRVIWCGKNYTAKKLVKVWLDNDSYVTTAPEHPFVMRDGTSKRADELVVGESLMPLYRKLSTKKEGFDIEGYETVYDPNKESYVFTHRLVANKVLHEQREQVRSETDWKLNNNLTVHHVDINRLNNSPNNLQWLGNVDHIKLHATMGRDNIIKYNKSDAKKKRTSILNKRRNSVEAMSWYNGSELHSQHNEIRRQVQLKSWSDSVEKAKRSSALRYEITDKMFERICEIVKEQPKWGKAKVHDALMADDEFTNGLKKQKLGRNVSKFSTSAWQGDLIRRGYDKGLTGLRESIVGYKNHKVARIEYLDVAGEDVYCMTVVGPNGEDDRHNFAVCGLKMNSDGLTKSVKVVDNGIFLKNSVDEDYFIPVRGGDTGTKIDTLQAGQNTGTVEDVAYIQKKLFASLKIPRAYLGYDEMLSSKATLAQEDIRFSRSIGVIQKTIVAELNKLAIIHLYANGFRDEDLINFTLRLSNPSTVAQQQKLELWRAKFEIAGSAPEGMMSKPFIYKNIMELTDDEIDDINKQRLRDKIIDAMIEGGEGGEGGAGGGGGGGDLFGGAGGDLGGGGGDEDIFGGGEEGGGGEDLGGEEPPEENAGEEPEEEEEPQVDLLTSSDDADDPERFKLPSADISKPVKLTPQLKHSLYNRSRRRTHGASKTHMPDFASMVSHEDREDTLKDPYDMNYLKSLLTNPMAESIDENPAGRPRIGSDTVNMLKRMSEKFGGTEEDSDMLLEGEDVQDEIDSGGVLSEVVLSDDLIEIVSGSSNVDDELVIVEHDSLDDEE